MVGADCATVSSLFWEKSFKLFFPDARLPGKMFSRQAAAAAGIQRRHRHQQDVAHRRAVGEATNLVTLVADAQV